MKPIIIVGLLSLLFVSGVLAYSTRTTYGGDIGVNTWITEDAFSLCISNSNGYPYTVHYNVTNYNVSNATAINVTYEYNITDNGNLVKQQTSTRYLGIGETRIFHVKKCTIGLGNHTIVSRILVVDPSTDLSAGNNYDSATIILS